MREIIFRGLWTRKKEWIYGSLAIFGDDDYNIYVNDENKLYQVDPNTVCQYTGLKDRNRKTVFEGDILRREVGGIFVVQWSKVLAKFEAKLISYNKIAYFNTMIFGECEVIGNIYDNPDLINIGKGIKDERV